MEWDGDRKYTLSNGVSFYAFGGCLGLDAYSGRLHEGWDGDVSWLEGTADDEGDRPLAPEERREIADVMIDRWNRWAAGDIREEA